MPDLTGDALGAELSCEVSHDLEKPLLESLRPRTLVEVVERVRERVATDAGGRRSHQRERRSVSRAEVAIDQDPERHGVSTSDPVHEKCIGSSHHSRLSPRVTAHHRQRADCRETAANLPRKTGGYSGPGTNGSRL